MNFDNYTAFSLVVVGNVPMPGPIVITYHDEIGGNTTGNRPMLIHWNPGRKIRNFKDIIWIELTYIIKIWKSQTKFYKQLLYIGKYSPPVYFRPFSPR